MAWLCMCSECIQLHNCAENNLCPIIKPIFRFSKILSVCLIYWHSILHIKKCFEVGEVRKIEFNYNSLNFLWLFLCVSFSLGCVICVDFYSSLLLLLLLLLYPSFVLLYFNTQLIKLIIYNDLTKMTANYTKETASPALVSRIINWVHSSEYKKKNVIIILNILDSNNAILF